LPYDTKGIQMPYYTSPSPSATLGLSSYLSLGSHERFCFWSQESRKILNLVAGWINLGFYLSAICNKRKSMSQLNKVEKRTNQLQNETKINDRKDIVTTKHPFYSHPSSSD